MGKIAILRLLCACVSLVGLGGCGNPYGQSISSANYNANPSPGEISVSSPKLYRREALINERREEVNYISGLIGQSGAVHFTPEIIRQLEVIRALTASVGLKFDPASGLQYRRTQDKADLQQQIDVLNLQMQLDKLKRDSELLKDTLTKQTDPSGAAGAPGAGGTTVTVNPVQTNSVTDLIAAVKDLTEKLQTALSTNVSPLTGSSIAANPIDDFNDRAVYRELLNNARNAASLDELHDRDGSALIRLNMMATVFPPDKARQASFGKLRMELHRPEPREDSPEFLALYRDWVTFVSPLLSQPLRDPSGKLFDYEPTTLGQVLSERSDIVDLIPFEFSMWQGGKCRGLVVPIGSLPQAGCFVVQIAAPRLRLPDSAAGSNPDGDFSLRNLLLILSNPKTPFSEAANALLDSGAGTVEFDDTCGLATKNFDKANGPGLSVGTTVTYAFAVEPLLAATPDVELRAQAIVNDLDRAEGGDTSSHNRIYYLPVSIAPDIRGRARATVDVIKRLAEKKCAKGTNLHVVDPTVPAAFLRALNYGSTAIYQLGPRQQVQIISTEARAAEAISLAASVSAQSPAQGIGGDAAFGFSRSAVGKADALERVPLVVAFASTETTSSDSAVATPARFGWMLGPRAVIDTQNKKISFAHGLRPQELTADLVVPGWWPYLTLESTSTWAPKWEGNDGKPGTEGKPREIKVPLSPSTSDFEQLTSHLLGGSSPKIAAIGIVEPSSVSVCATNFALQLRGANIWRADKVVIGGKVIDGDSISVLAGMEGLLVKIDKAEFSVADATVAKITALTPYGPASHSLGLTGKTADCAKATTPDAAAGNPKPPAKPAVKAPVKLKTPTKPVKHAPATKSPVKPKVTAKPAAKHIPRAL